MFRKLHAFLRLLGKIAPLGYSTHFAYYVKPMEHRQGRPRVYTGEDEPMVVMAIRTTAWHKRIARKIGNGNASEAIRYLLEYAAENKIRIPGPIKEEEK